MSAEVKKEIQLEIAHVLFIDIVGYSKLSVNEQHAAVEELNQIVRASEQFERAEAASRLLKIPTGDGMALGFYTSPEAPAQCAVEISRGLKEHPRLQLRMGIHSGPVSGVVDVNNRPNLAGAGINMAQRVMDCGDAGHILLSKHVAEDLEEYEQWRPLLHDLGTCEVKHGVRVSVVNLYDDQFGNATLPRKFETVQKHRAYVLFIDIVGYSKLVVDQQRRLLELLNQIVRGTEQFRKAEATHRLITIPTGDGMALVFYNTPEAPVECALEISRAAREHPELKLRMGVHSGPVSGVVDVSGRANIAGAGINIAQRVMDCGDAEHILLSRHVAEDLEQLGHWKKHLHDLGEVEVKHGSRVSVVNLYTEELGNPEVPQKFLQARHKTAAAVPMAVEKPSRSPGWLIGVAALVLIAGLAVGGYLFSRRSSEVGSERRAVQPTV